MDAATISSPATYDGPFAQLHDQGAAGRGEDEPHEREDAHDHGRRRRADVERGGELGQHRCHEAKTDRDQEGRHQHHLDVPGQPGAPRGAGRDLGCGVAGGAGGVAHDAFVLGQMRGRLAAGLRRGINPMKHNRNKCEMHHLRPGGSCNNPAM